MAVPPRYLAEFVGTYLLVFTVGCNVIAGNAVWAGTSIGCVLMVAIYALATVSGANFNPAVSVALGLSGKLAWKDVCIYAVTQIVAGILAALSYGALFGFTKVFNLAPAEGFGWWEAGLAEVFYTLMLCFVVLNTAAAQKNTPNQFYGISIGFVIVAGAYGAGAISGGCFNPAVALGIDVSSMKLGFGWSLAYVGYELVGAALASGLFRLCRPDDFGGSADYTLMSRLVSEFLGTFFLVLTVGLNVMAKSPAAAWSIAASLMCMIFSLGNVSGAHFNPAVTLSVVLSGRNKCSPGDAVKYMVVQIIGGICAAFTTAAMYHKETFAVEPGAGYDFVQAGLAEMFATFVLCFVVLSVATVREPLSQYFGLAIGMCVTSGGFAIGAVSGGFINPAICFGVSSAHVMNGGNFYHCLIYTAFECAGAAVAALVFRGVRPDEYAKGVVELEAYVAV